MLVPTCLLSLAAGVALASTPQNAMPFAESLPRTSGAAVVPGLSAPVAISRDAVGVPVIDGRTLEDAIRGQGFAHGQDRFFQMDMMRRYSAGRLAEVTGGAMLYSDRIRRRYRMESVAEGVIARMPEYERRLIEAYVEGVNAGLADLGAAPPEYVVLQAEPAPWTNVDTILVIYTMCDSLNFNARIERRLGVMAETLPVELFRLLTPDTTRFDLPLVAGAGDDPRGYRPVPIPPVEVVDLRAAATPLTPIAPNVVAPTPLALGSNNWAVAGSRTTHGDAVVANDPHLEITAPGLWYRCEIAWDGGRARGVSLPGAPGVIIGATDRLAWGFTNTMGDFQDLVVVEVDPDDPTHYLVPGGREPFEEIVDEIAVLGAPPEPLTLRRTRWGVVTGADAGGRPLVLKWTALHPEMINFRILRMLEAATLEDGVDIARSWYGPSQNTLIADDRGRIAWVVSGYFPKRVGFDGTVPVSWARPGVGWDGPLDESHRPVLVDPEDGVLFTANNRTVGVGRSRRLGNSWALGARATRIRQLLGDRVDLDEKELRAIQLDTRVQVLDLYRDLLLEATRGAVPDAMKQARAIARGWNGTADADQPGARILEAYRRALHDAVLGPLVMPCRTRDESFDYWWFADEEPVRRVLETRAPHLLPPGWDGWDDLLRGTLATVLDRLVANAPAEGLARSWGDANRARIRHPLADGAPAYAAMLNMPDDPLAGHSLAVRVATPSYGASLRIVVSPSHPERGLLHIPAGQSGHPMSPHYRSSHRAWLDGLPTPLVAGPTVTRFSLVPGD